MRQNKYPTDGTEVVIYESEQYIWSVKSCNSQDGITYLYKTDSDTGEKSLADYMSIEPSYLCSWVEGVITGLKAVYE